MKTSTWLRLATLGLVSSIAMFACNDYPLTPLGDTLDSVRVELSPEIGTNAVDILWLVDNSGSMRAQQIELARQFNEFVEALADLGADFNMAVVTTDTARQTENGRFMTRPGQCTDNIVTADFRAYCETLNFDHGNFLTASNYTDADGDVDVQRLQDDFRCIASQGICGSPFEMGLDAIRRALSPELQEGFNAGFLRDDAFLVVIFLTDEDDCSVGDGPRPTSNDSCYRNRQSLVPVDAYYEFLVDLKGGDESKVLIAGIVGPPLPAGRSDPAGVSCISQLEGEDDDQTASAFDSLRYRELIAMAGERGVYQSICQGTFVNALRTIGRAIRSSLDVNCLLDQPQTCDTNADCFGDALCINPQDPSIGAKYCDDFEIVLEISTAENPTVFTQLRGPGPAGLASPVPGHQFTVDYDAQVCGRGVSFSFERGERPRAGSRYRAFYPVQPVLSGGQAGPGAPNVPADPGPVGE